jgi:hypothetical protein
MKRVFMTVTALAAMTAALNAQPNQRRAVMTGGGSADRGQCTIEVVVDGAAEVEIRGDTATLRDISGQPPQWRRFECTGALPANPANFAFRGIDGRGSQELVRDPRNGGVAVVRIEDPESGAGQYTFNLTWNAVGGYPGGQDRGGVDSRGADNRGGEIRGLDNRGVDNRGADNRGADNRGVDNRDYNRPDQRGGDQGRDRGAPYWRGSPNDALRACQDMVRQQAVQRFHTSNLQFRRVAVDDNPGRQDWISGTLAVRRGWGGREDAYRFSCSVNFDNGRVRSAQIDPQPGGQEQPGYRGQEQPGFRGNAAVANSPGVQACQNAAEERIRRDGYGRIEFGPLRAEDRPGRDDLVVGTATARGQYATDSFNFTCAVNLESGAVRSVDLTRR